MAICDREVRGPVGLVLIDNQPVNALSHAVRQGIADAVAALGADSSVRVIVIACRGRTFCAGADITEFGKPPQPPILTELASTIEASGTPVVAALHGTALGGGLEIALGCHFRIAARTAKLGLPEVSLGIIPGAGGTQRLPRLVGLDPALRTITTGEPIGAEDALKIGLVDRVAEGDLLDAAIAYAEELVAAGTPPRRASDMAIDPAGVTTEAFAVARKAALKRARGARAPLVAIDAIEHGARHGFAEGLANERRLVIELIGSTEAKALRHLFFAERRARDLPPELGTPAAGTIGKLAVIGAGTMGAGIATAALNAGLTVVLVDVTAEAVAAGRTRIAETYAGDRAKGRIDEATAQARMARLATTTDHADLGDVDLVIEAVFEDMAVKREVFASLDRHAPPHAILATNTSYLDIDEVAQATQRPGQVIGLHFFSPAHVMKLLEIVRTGTSAPETIATAFALAKTLGKIPALAGVCHGFIGNRMLQGYLREANRLLLEGVEPARIDAALTAFGMPMGPFTMIDMAGIDIGYSVRKRIPAAQTDAWVFEALDALVDRGRKGQKTGAGVYRYEPGDRTPHPDPLVLELAAEAAARNGVAQRPGTSDEAIVERTVLALVNEGARILDEGIAVRASDIDVVYAHGYGFPRHRGGPMFYGETLGWPHILDRLTALAREVHPRSFAPAGGIVRLVRGGGGLFG